MFKIVISALIFAGIFTAAGCQPGERPVQDETEQVVLAAESESPGAGSIERLDPELDKIISRDAMVEILADSFSWSEGPLWIPEKEMLLFSDIPPNKIYKWTEEKGIQLYLTPSGYTGEEPRKGEQGANGLLLDKEGRLVLCQHGDRRIARMEAPLENPEPVFSTLANAWEGKKLNSPNDAVYKSNGDLYFTDPPYGLEENMEDPAKELPFQGVYRLDARGQVHLLTKELSRPNGVAFSADEKILYVANSDPENPVWMAYEIQEDGNLGEGQVFFDASSLGGTDTGLPDGMKVSRNGTLFATGPGGVLIFSKEGRHLGTIKTGQPTANCAFNEDESMLFITANMNLMRVKLK